MARTPDITHNPRWTPNASADFASYVSGLHTALRTDYAVPMPPLSSKPTLRSNDVVFSWTPAYDVTQSGQISYELQVASSANFTPDSILADVKNIKDSKTLIEQTVNKQLLPSNRKLYFRVTARVSTNPQRYWQVASNTVNVDGKTRFGVVEFELK